MHTSDTELIEQLLDQIENRLGQINEELENNEEFDKLINLVSFLLCGRN